MKEKEKKKIFREKSVDKFTAADELDHYTKASHPSLWIFLSALLCVAVGFLIWTFVGDVSITVSGCTSVENNIATIFIRSKEAEQVKVGQEVQINESFYTIKEKSSDSYKITKEMYEQNEYLAKLGGFNVGDWITEAYSEVKINNGSYKAEITVDHVKPVKFIFN